MATSYSSGVLDDYLNIRAIPAYLSAAFIVAGLYQFGGIAEVSLPWLNYTLTTEHSVVVSVMAWVVAFASSETRQFQNYEAWEKAAIAAGPALILGHEYTTEVTDLIMEFGDPLGLQLAFIATVVSWAVAVR